MEALIVKTASEYGVLGVVTVVFGVAVVLLFRHNTAITQGIIARNNAMMQRIIDKLQTSLDANTAAIKTLSETCMRNSILLDQRPRRSDEDRGTKMLLKE